MTKRKSKSFVLNELTFRTGLRIGSLFRLRCYHGIEDDGTAYIGILIAVKPHDIASQAFIRFYMLSSSDETDNQNNFVEPHEWFRVHYDEFEKLA